MTRPVFARVWIRVWINSISSKQRVSRWLFGLTFLALMMSPLSMGLGASVLANPITNTTRNEPDFSGTGRPPERRGRQSRGDDACPNPEQAMTPLVPQGEGGGWTTMVNPTVWVHVPFALSDRYRAKLIVKAFHVNEEGEEEETRVVGERFNLPTTDKAGVYQFTLPLNDEQFSSIPPLATTDAAPIPGYRWTLEIFCNPDGGKPVVAEGIIRRVDIDPSANPAWQDDSPESISDAYAQNRIWYDALTVLGEAIHSEADSESNAGVEAGAERYQAAWQELLSYSTVGLEAIAHEPLINCCTLLNE
ncbi:MAG: DUF928 domain-containing protein [Cyanobacteria bacterium P01_F01_bin.150]